MNVVCWNIENALPRLKALPAVVEALGSPDVLCLQVGSPGTELEFAL